MFQSTRSPAMSRRRILVADDSATIRLSLEVMLGARYDVHLAADGQAAVTLALTVKPDLILLDVMMPRMDGLAACRALRAIDPTRNTPIIMVTSQVDEWDVEAGYDAGCTDYIGKPVDEDELLSKVESWLPSGALAGVLA